MISGPQNRGSVPKYVQGRVLGVKLLRKNMSKKFTEKEGPKMGV